MAPERRFSRLLILGVASALAAAAPAGADLPRAPLRPRAAAPAAGEAVVARAAALARAGDCKGVLTLLDPLVAGGRGQGNATRFSAQMLRLPCLGAVGRASEVEEVLTELKAQAPDNPLVQGYQVLIDADSGRYAAAADGLAGLADARSPALALMPGALWRALAEQLTAAGDAARRDRVALALALADWNPPDDPELGETLDADGIGALLDQQSVDDGRQLLARVIRPNLLWEMAIQHRYAALWPEIEARIGPKGGAAVDRFARAALDAYASSPDDPQARLDAARAFLFLGRFADVPSVAAGVAIHPGMSENEVQTVLVDGHAMAAGGDLDRAIGRLRPFAAGGLKDNPQAAGAVVSLAELLDQAGRFDEELALAASGTGAEAAYFSPYGQAWLLRNRVCALEGLHRPAEARAAGDVLKAATGDNQAAAIEGLLCSGRDDEAAAIAVAALATSDGADRLADQFQPDGALLPHPPSRLRALWERLLRRPEVKAAFDRVARIMPRSYWPDSAPRPLPPPADRGASTT